MRTRKHLNLAVAAGRRIARSSGVAHGVGTAVRLLTSGSAAFSISPSASSVVMARLISEGWRFEPDRVVTVADRSRLLQAFEQLFERSVRAWQASATRTRVEKTLNAAPPAARVRLAGWMGFGAAATHIWLVGIAAAGVGWIAAVPFALACIWRPEAILAASKASRLRRGRDRSATL